MSKRFFCILTALLLCLTALAALAEEVIWITLVPNNGKKKEGGLVCSAGGVLILEEPGAYEITQPAGRYFAGWLVDGAVYPAGEEIPIARETKAVAQWKDRASLPCAVMLHYGNGQADEPLSVPYGDPLAEPAAPVWAGYVFRGWFLDAEGARAYDFSKPVKENFDLFAAWEADESGAPAATLTLNPANGQEKAYLPVANAGDAITLEAAFAYGFTAPAGKGFGGWLVGERTVYPGEQVTVQRDMTAAALWLDESLLIPGDVTGDGKVNIMDVIRLLKKVSGWTVEVARMNADTNGDGAINIMDVIRLLKYASGWEVTLGR